MKRFTLALVLALTIASVTRADDPPPAPERSLIVTLKWEAAGPSVDKVDRKEGFVAPQYGFPQLTGRFFELVDGQGDVHYAGRVIDPRARDPLNPPPEATSRITLPDLPEARRLIIYERVSSGPKPGRTKILTHDF
jgi:hypothetical protein